MVGPAGFEPATNRLCVPLQLSLPLSGLRSGLSLHPRGMPAVQSLHLSWHGQDLARDCHCLAAPGFPEFDRIYLLVAQQAALNILAYLFLDLAKLSIEPTALTTELRARKQLLTQMSNREEYNILRRSSLVLPYFHPCVIPGSTRDPVKENPFFTGFPSRSGMTQEWRYVARSSRTPDCCILFTSVRKNQKPAKSSPSS